MWFVYIVQCADQSLYTGSCTNVLRRLHEHNHDDKKGARYTKVRRPVQLVYQEECANRSTAGKREAAIKKLTRQKKLQLINAGS
jgi:putative endonuclease